MKAISVLLLCASLALNLALGYGLVAGRPATPDPGVAVSAAKSATKTADAAPDPALWSQLASTDKATLVRQFKEAGFPPRIIRAILEAEIDEQYGTRMRALIGDPTSRPYWKSIGFDAATMASLRQLAREREKRLDDLLGPDRDADSLPIRRYSFLPADRAAEVRQIVDEFNDKRSALYEAGNTSMSEKMAEWEKAQHDALAAVLTPEQLLAYDLRNSRTAGMLRERLAAFSPTEEEFVAIYKVQSLFESQYSVLQGGMSQPSPIEMRQRAEVMRQLNEQIKGVLAPERAVAFERMTDFNYVQTSRLVARLELPPETADNVYAVQKQYEQRHRDLLRDRSLTMDQRAEQSKVMQNEAIAVLTPLLGGERGLNAYKQYGGSWLDYMAVRLPSRPPSSTPPGQ